LHAIEVGFPVGTTDDRRKFGLESNGLSLLVV
jgi:hypothetical protein